METTEAEAEGTMVGHTATGVVTTRAVITRVFTLAINAALGEGTVSVGATASSTDTGSAQETLGAVLVLSALRIAVVIATRLATVALLRGAAFFKAEAAFTRAPRATFTVR